MAKTDDPKKDPKEKAKEPIPKVRNAGHFLFEDTGGSFEEVASYSDLKSFQQGVKEKASAISDGKPIPKWVHFRGTFKEIEIQRIRDVRVKL